MDKIIFNVKSKNNSLFIDKKIIPNDKQIKKINKYESSFLMTDTLDKYIESLKSIIKNNIFQDIIIKQIYSLLNKISDFAKNINSQFSQYQNLLIYNETKLRNLQGILLSELMNKEILQNDVNRLSQNEKYLELIKEKTGIFINNGNIINANRKENEIIILRTENSKLKSVIGEYETKLFEKEKEFKKINMNLQKEINELILKIQKLNNQIKNNQNNKYSKYNIAKKKLTINYNNKKSIDLLATTINDSNDNNINNPSIINEFKINDNNYYIDSNKSKLYNIKMNTIESSCTYAINHSYKHSKHNTKIKDKLKILGNKKDDIIKGDEKSNNLTSRTIDNKTSYQNPKIKLNKKRNTHKALSNHIYDLYNKIIFKENNITKIDNSKKQKIVKSKTKSHKHHLSNVENYISNNNKILNSNSIKNKPTKHVFHKKCNSSKINSIPFNNNNQNNQNMDINNNENKNENNLVNIKNLILSKAQKNKKNKMYLIYRNLVSNSITNYNSINNSRNFKIKNNIPRLYTSNTSK